MKGGDSDLNTPAARQQLLRDPLDALHVMLRVQLWSGVVQHLVSVPLWFIAYYIRPPPVSLGDRAAPATASLPRPERGPRPAGEVNPPSSRRPG
jgi:hypothetical protein